jgi:proton-translocating NADH-quinone oxidoreductase chain N
MGLGAAGDLFNLWMWFEALAVAAYMLVAFQRQAPRTLEAAFKYLIQSAAGSVMILLGIALVFSQTGILDLAQLRAPISNANANLGRAALALFVIGFGVKAALVPLHTWLPDAHAQAPSGISAMLSGVVIEAALIALLRVSLPLASQNGLAFLFLLLGAANMLAGNLLALRQVQVKRLLAFSSVAQVGYIVFGLGISLWDREPGGAQGAFLHLLNHGLMKGLAFLAAGALLFVLRAGLAHDAPLTVADLAGAARRYPVTAFAFSIALLGLGGLPPLAGFMSKWQIFVAGVDAGSVWLDALVVFAALNSVLSLAYYAPLVNAMYRGHVSPVVARGEAMPRGMTAPLALLAACVFVLGVAPNMLNWLTLPASQAFQRALGD